MWNKIKAWFSDSETVAWARVQMLAGAVLEVLMITPVEPLVGFLPPAWMPFVLFAHGVFLEYIRKRRATDL